MSHRWYGGMTFICLLMKTSNRSKDKEGRGETTPTRCCLSTTKLQWWFKKQIRSVPKNEDKLYAMVQTFLLVDLFIVFFNTFSKAFQFPVNFAVFSKLSLLVITLSQQVSLALGAEVYLLYVERSISSGSSPTFTSKRSCTSFSILASFSSETKVMARPFVPKRPALATWCKLETTWS